MTTEQIGNVEPPGDDLPPVDPPEVNPILTEITQLNEQEGPEGTQAPEVPEAPEAPQQEAPTEPIAETPVQPQAQPQYTPAQVQQMQQQAAQYQEMEAKAALQNQTQSYRRELENQGFLPEHAEQAASYYMQSQQQQLNLVQKADEYAQHVQGQMLVAELFVKKYSLGIGDLTTLRTYNDPQSMEGAAKRLSADREKDAELTKLRQAQVPAQQFDNSQGEPSVAQNDASWLDRYNSGDRSPNSVAAARRATGLE